MNNHHTLGTFCSVAKKGTIIMPKKIHGYKEPEGQVLQDNGQKINFVYTPIEYNISYDFAGGKEISGLKKTYTIEDSDYYPEAPTRSGYHFNGWEPKSIPTGTTGDVKFIATWIANPTFLNGKKLNKAFDKIANGKENISSIVLIDHKLEVESFNVSCTSTKIHAYYLDGVIYLYSDYPIWCNENMDEAFEGFTILKNIDCFKYFNCKIGTSINSIFSGCTLLSNVESVENWADGKFISFIDAFKGTIAMASSRVPSWYRWHETLIYKSSSGKILESVEDNRIPGEEIYGKAFNGYKTLSGAVPVTRPDSEIVFEYNPIEYGITYVLNGGELINPKTKYTIEDETYYPPEPVKSGYRFTGWDRECITSGETGNVVFIAHYDLK